MSETAVEDPTEEPKTKEPEEPAQDDGARGFWLRRVACLLGVQTFDGETDRDQERRHDIHVTSPCPPACSAR